MSVRQVDLARMWNLGRSQICRYVKQGMPLTSAADAAQWRCMRYGKVSPVDRRPGHEDGVVHVAVDQPQPALDCSAFHALVEREEALLQELGPSSPETPELVSVRRAVRDAAATLCRGALGMASRKARALVRTARELADQPPGEDLHAIEVDAAVFCELAQECKAAVKIVALPEVTTQGIYCLVHRLNELLTNEQQAHRIAVGSLVSDEELDRDGGAGLGGDT